MNQAELPAALMNELLGHLQKVVLTGIGVSVAEAERSHYRIRMIGEALRAEGGRPLMETALTYVRRNYSQGAYSLERSWFGEVRNRLPD